MNSFELTRLVDTWFKEWAKDPKISKGKGPYYHVAQRAQDCILDELEPLHADAVKSIRSCTSEGATWHRSVADRLEAFVDSHRPGDVELALEILATIPCDDEDIRFPTSAQLGIIRKALLSTRKNINEH